MQSPKPDVVRVNRFGNDSIKPVITINAKYGRMYFSLFAIKALKLDESYFRIFKTGSRWFLMKTNENTDFKLTVHAHAYYIVCKPLVNGLVDHFKHEVLSFLIDGVERKRKYYPLTFYVPERKSKRAYGEAKADSRWKHPRLASAEQKISNFETTNFIGRVKTNEILRAEQLLNRTSTINNQTN